MSEVTASCAGSAVGPEILDLRNGHHRRRFDELVGGCPRGVARHDTIYQQLSDYVRLSHPAVPPTDGWMRTAIRDTLDGLGMGEFGRWVFYPWSLRLVHVLPPGLFESVRENRNLHKVTLEERQRLQRFNIGVVGLSVGSAVARTLSLEGIGGVMRLADFDVLDLSNLNRLQAAVHDVGVNKAVLCARQIYETNPYASVEAFSEGVTRDNIARFIGGPPRLDVLVDECDTIEMKILLREHARARRIPVIMATSDRGMLDVERFDLEPDRPIFHGLVGDLRSQDVVDLTMEQKVEYVLRILSPAEISARAAGSMLEIERSVVTWPQLASEVQLGGAEVTTAVRRLCLGLAMPSGRRYLDLDDLASVQVTDGARATEQPQVRDCVAAPRTASLAERIVWYAAAAPSVGNSQPWRFIIDGPSVEIACDPSPSGYGDHRGLASHFAVGAAIENAVIAAGELGSEVELSLLPPAPHTGAVARLTWDSPRDPAVHSSKRLDTIVRRATNRRLGDGSPLESEAAAALVAATGSDSVHLQFVHGIEERREIGRLLGAFDRIQFTVPELHGEVMREMRWTAQEAARTCDGMEFATLELTTRDLLALQLVARPDVAHILRAPGRGRALEELARKAMESSSAVGLLRVNGATPAAFIEAGRAMQRTWLEATELGLGLQPWTALTFVSRLLDYPKGRIFTGAEAAELRGLVARLDETFAQRSDWAAAMLFRVSHAAPVTARSRRRPIEQVIVSPGRAR